MKKTEWMIWLHYTSGKVGYIHYPYDGIVDAICRLVKIRPNATLERVSIRKVA